MCVGGEGACAHAQKKHVEGGERGDVCVRVHMRQWQSGHDPTTCRTRSSWLKQHPTHYITIHVTYNYRPSHLASPQTLQRPFAPHVCHSCACMKWGLGLAIGIAISDPKNEGSTPAAMEDRCHHLGPAERASLASLPLLSSVTSDTTSCMPRPPHACNRKFKIYTKSYSTSDAHSLLTRHMEGLLLRRAHRRHRQFPVSPPLEYQRQMISQQRPLELTRCSPATLPNLRFWPLTQNKNTHTHTRADFSLRKKRKVRIEAEIDRAGHAIYKDPRMHVQDVTHNPA